MSIGSFFRQLTFAIYYRERNFLLSNAVNDDSKVLYVRDPLDRVEKAAPFLKVDGDPYPAVINGRVDLDPRRLHDVGRLPVLRVDGAGRGAQDSLTGAGTTALPNEQFNYIRNSVKATVDAYDGTVTLYQWDKKDPVLTTYMKALPGRRQARAATSPTSCVSHVRYPEDLFKLQRDILTRYHVDKPVDFYNQSDRWQVPTDPTKNTQDAQPPYYILAQRPGDDRASFQLTSALNAFNRENLSSFISASSDPKTYGQIQVLRLPGNTPFRGPQQVQQSFITNNQVRPGLTLFNSQDSKVGVRQPAHAADRRERPALRRAAVRAGHGPELLPAAAEGAGQLRRPGRYADTLQEALDQVFGAGRGRVGTGGGTTTPPPTGGSTTADAGDADHESARRRREATNPAMDQAVADIQPRSQALKAAQTQRGLRRPGPGARRPAERRDAYQAAQQAVGVGRARPADRGGGRGRPRSLPARLVGWSLPTRGGAAR